MSGHSQDSTIAARSGLWADTMRHNSSNLGIRLRALKYISDKWLPLSLHSLPLAREWWEFTPSRCTFLFRLCSQRSFPPPKNSYDWHPWYKALVSTLFGSEPPPKLSAGPQGLSQHPKPLLNIQHCISSEVRFIFVRVRLLWGRSGYFLK